MSYCVYKHTSPSGKVYIGITRQNPLVRWCNGFGYRGQSYFFKSILKYGWDNFTHEILFTGLTKEEACQREIELIDLYKSNQREFGYNISSGGEYGNYQNGKSIKYFICPYCKQEYKTRENKRKYCSPKCQHNALRTSIKTTISKGCGKEFVFSTRRRKGVYCSRECYLNHV